MNYYVGNMPYSDELFHYGLKGQKWGIRRFQNEDGSLTPAGKERYGSEKALNKMARKDAQRKSDADAAYGPGSRTRRKLIDRELSQKKKDATYAKAYEEAEKHVDIAKSYKRAEKLNKHAGTFSRGQELHESGYKYSKSAQRIGKAAATSILSAGAGYIFASAVGFDKNGRKAFAALNLAVTIPNLVKETSRSVKNAHAYNYYQKNRKF